MFFLCVWYGVSCDFDIVLVLWFGFNIGRIDYFMKIFFVVVCVISFFVFVFVVSVKFIDCNELMFIDVGVQIGMFDGNGKIILFQGVIVIQGMLDLCLFEVEIYFKDGELVCVVFIGKQVKFKQQFDDGSWMDVLVDCIDYDIKGEVFMMIGNYNVKSVCGINVGQKMIYNICIGEMNSGGDGICVCIVIQLKVKVVVLAVVGSKK